MKRHRLAVRLDEQSLVDRRRRRLASVEGDRFAAIVVEQEGAAANPARLRLDQAEHHLGADCRVDRRPASSEQGHTGFAGQRMRRRHGKLPPLPASLNGALRGTFWLARVGRADGRRSGGRREVTAAGGQQCRDQGKAEDFHGWTPMGRPRLCLIQVARASRKNSLADLDCWPPVLVFVGISVYAYGHVKQSTGAIEKMAGAGCRSGRRRFPCRTGADTSGQGGAVASRRFDAAGGSAGRGGQSGDAGGAGLGPGRRSACRCRAGSEQR
jgi:hypothetical protein